MPIELPKETVSVNFQGWANFMWEDVYTRPSVVNKSRALCRSFAQHAHDEMCYTESMDKNIDPGDGYRLLTEGETIMPRDEYYAAGGTWKATGDDGKSQGSSTDVPRRRKITKKRVEVTSDFKRDDIVVLPNGNEERLDLDSDLYVNGDYMGEENIRLFGLKVYREIEPKKTRCYMQCSSGDDFTKISTRHLEKDEFFWVSNKEPLTFKEED